MSPITDAAVRGPAPLHIATFTVRRANNNKTRNTEFGATGGSWELGEFGAALGFMVGSTASRLEIPDRRPAGLIGLEIIGGGGFQDAVMPWFGEIHNNAGVGGAIIAITGARRISLLTRLGQHPREIRVFGADTAAAVGDKVQLNAVLLGG